MSCIVTTREADLAPAAKILAQQLHLPYQAWQADLQGLALEMSKDALQLCLYAQNAPGAVWVDFANPTLTFRRQHLSSEMLVKAVGCKSQKKLTILDATAGLGQDAFILASLGCQLQLIERHPVVAALLQDGLDRASQDEALTEIRGRMQLHQADARLYLENLTPEHYPDVIYLDPMFPEKRKSALPNKSMQLLQLLLGVDEESEDLLSIAISKAKIRVVVKRPKHAPCLLQSPNFSLKGQSSRFDVYLGGISSSRPARRGPS